ncbi:hypothetical protein ACLOJK_025238 [Asimina triloba]
MVGMKNSVSERSLYIESDDEEDLNAGAEEKDTSLYDDGRGRADEEDGHESYSSESSFVSGSQQNKPGSYNTTWPQSYR